MARAPCKTGATSRPRLLVSAVSQPRLLLAHKCCMPVLVSTCFRLLAKCPVLIRQADSSPPLPTPAPPLPCGIVVWQAEPLSQKRRDPLAGKSQLCVQCPNGRKHSSLFAVRRNRTHPSLRFQPLFFLPPLMRPPILFGASPSALDLPPPPSALLDHTLLLILLIGPSAAPLVVDQPAAQRA